VSNYPSLLHLFLPFQILCGQVQFVIRLPSGVLRHWKDQKKDSAADPAVDPFVPTGDDWVLPSSLQLRRRLLVLCDRLLLNCARIPVHCRVKMLQSP